MPKGLPAQLPLFAGEIPSPEPTLPIAWPVGAVGDGRGGIEVCVLASGSSGNATLVRVGGPGGRVMLMDAGIGPRTMGKRLGGTGVELSDVEAVCVTHLDQDHFRPTWVPTLVKRGIAVYLARRHLRSLETADPRGWLRAEGLVRVIDDGDAAEPVGGVRVRAVRLPHDWKGSTGYVVRAGAAGGWGGQSLGYATDLGRVPEALVEAFAGVDILAIESNYDRRMQVESPRPAVLKKRIMGGYGHLSNDEALDAAHRVMRASGGNGGGPSRVVLLHRSRQCNSPACIRRTFGRVPAVAARIVLTEQHERTGWISAVGGRGARRCAERTG